MASSAWLIILIFRDFAQLDNFGSDGEASLITVILSYLVLHFKFEANAKAELRE